MNYREQRVVQLLGIFGYGENGNLRASRLDVGARAVHKQIDEGMARLMGDTSESRWPFEELKDGVKLVYRRAAIKCLEAVRDA
jgi:hypothetical protein